MNRIILILLTTISFGCYSQMGEVTETNIRKHSIGVDYRFEGGASPNIGITYRRYFTNSKYNLRANFTIGSKKYYKGLANQPYSSGNLLIFSTGDSAIPLIGVTEQSYQSNSYQRFEIGAERESKLWRMNIITGIDFTFGHRQSSSYGRIVEAELVEIEKGGFTYYQYGLKDADSTFPDYDLNYLNSNYNYLTVGGNLRGGFKFNLSNRLFATAIIGVRFEGQFLIRESLNYKNDLYKEHLPSYSSGNSANLESFVTFGLQYKI